LHYCKVRAGKRWALQENVGPLTGTGRGGHPFVTVFDVEDVLCPHEKRLRRRRQQRRVQEDEHVIALRRRIFSGQAENNRPKADLGEAAARVPCIPRQVRVVRDRRRTDDGAPIVPRCACVRKMP
jgi:hypothetical protein